MKIAVSIFYVLAAVVVICVKVVDIVRRLIAKRYVRHLQKTKAYLADIRPEKNTSIIKRWTELKGYADWFDARIAGPPGALGKHARAVSNKEIDDLIKDCTAFIKVVKKALREEHRIYRRLSDADKEAWPADAHARWHSIYDKLAHVRHTYKALRQNVARNDAR